MTTKEIPDTATAGFLAFALLNELIDLLITKGSLTQAEANGLFVSLRTRLENSTRHAAEPAKAFLRDTKLGN